MEKPAHFSARSVTELATHRQVRALKLTYSAERIRELTKEHFGQECIAEGLTGDAAGYLLTLPNERTPMPKEEQALATIEDQFDAVTQRELTETALEVNGAIRALNSLTENLNAQVIHALQRFRDEKLYEAYGFKRFDEYLDKSPKSPMTYATFNRREKLLEAEGDEVYNLLESLRVPANSRKSLPPASFEVREDQLIATDDKGQEYEVPLSDTRRVKSIINNIAREYKDTKKKLADETRKTEALSNRVKELADAKPKLNSELTTPHGEALLFAITALSNLADKAEELSDEEAIAFRKNAIETIGQVMTRLHTAYRFSLEKPDTAAPSTNGNGKPKTRKPTDAEIQAALGD